MAVLNFDANTVVPDVGQGDPVPEGWYSLMVTGSELVPTKDSATTGNAYLKVEFSIQEGAHKGRKIWANFNIRNSNPVAQEIAFKQLSAVAHAVKVLMIQDSQQLHGIPLKGRVKIKKGSVKDAATGERYSDSNDIVMYREYNDPTAVNGASAAAVPAFPGAAPAGMPAMPGMPSFVPAAMPAAPAGAPALPGMPSFGAPIPIAAFSPSAAGAPPAFAPPPATFVMPAPPVPAAPVHTMTAAANGVTYDQYKAAGWSDEQMISGGLLAAPAAPAPLAPPPFVAPAAPAAPAALPVAPPVDAAAAAAQSVVPPWARGA